MTSNVPIRKRGPPDPQLRGRLWCFHQPATLNVTVFKHRDVSLATSRSNSRRDGRATIPAACSRSIGPEGTYKGNIQTGATPLFQYDAFVAVRPQLASRLLKQLEFCKKVLKVART